MVYHKDDEFVVPSAEGADDSVTGTFVERREEGLRPRTELPKLAVKTPFEPV